MAIAAGFNSGADTLPNIIDGIADVLIASSADWTEGDSTWDISDTTADNARRVVKYSGDTADIWIALESINAPKLIYNYFYAKGLRVTFSASWDTVGHTYPTSHQQTFIQFEAHSSTPTADLGTLLLTHYLWLDVNGFSIMAVPEPNASDNYQGSFICVVERNSTKFYSDGYSNFYCFNETNNRMYDVYDHARTKRMIRPFAYEINNDTPIHFYYDPWYAFKSNQGKVYYVKPMISSSSDGRDPIFQSEHFFKWNTGVGLVDGDVIATTGTTKYICKSLASPDSTTTINYAIKYVA